MRNNIVHIGAGELTYEIRGIVPLAQKLENLGVKVIWENIGDPVAKGEILPDWIKAIVHNMVQDDSSYAYCPTKGLDDSRSYIAELNNRRGGARISEENILFFNGTGDAITKIYSLLRREARVIGPSPAYSTHSSAEASHAGLAPLTYKLDPENNWYPDIDDLRNKVKYNNTISGILIINPDNPTGAVYPREILEEIIGLAKKYDLFIICDEIYQNIVYNNKVNVPLSLVVDDVCAISLKGISKEIPWPGARCGWIEIYNAGKDSCFDRYVESIVNAKMVEVCSTTLPQKAIPKIMQHPNYQKYLMDKNAFYERASNLAYEILSPLKDLIIVNRTNGAFYMSIVFRKGVLKSDQRLPIHDPMIKEFVDGMVRNVPLDKRFVYFLLASTGICVVPLSSFCSDLPGFRITLLEKDPDVFHSTFDRLRENIVLYVHSC
ncbi:MAG: pyridoxal phosphate-dependent aminotransferase [bacterium]